MSTWQGIGTAFRGYGFKQGDGSHTVTRWFVLMHMPVIPLARHRVVVGDSTQTRSGNVIRSVTSFGMLGKTRLSVPEILATYVAWWVVYPAAVLLPLWLMYEAIEAINVDNGGWPMAACVVLFLVGLAAAMVAPAAITVWSRHRRGLPG